MLFQSPLFALFFGVLVAMLLVLRGRGPRHALLLLASYAFYAAWDPRFLALLWISTAIDWWAGARIEASAAPRARRLWLGLSLIANLGILGTFKYFDFFTEGAAELAGALGVTLHPHTLNVVLPVGISFYTFQSMSYTFDVYRERLHPEPSLLRFALYVAFFPQLVAGPIVRARYFLPQLNRDAPPVLANLAPGALLFSVGLFKKTVIADHMARLVDPLFLTPEFYGSGALLLGLLAYAVQIYCDFSGYSDMAIGVGRILGYRLPRNFDRPYAARSPREFWRRWHISLSSWMHDYVYVALGGNRGSTARTHANTLLTMLLSGLWHGANWTFVVWGGLHGLGVTADRAIAPGRPRGWLGWLATTALVLSLWLCFRATSLSLAGVYAGRIATAPAAVELLDPLLLWWLAPLFALFCLGQSSVGARSEAAVRRWSPTLRMAAAGAVCALSYSLSAEGDRAFVYFQF